MNVHIYKHIHMYVCMCNVTPGFIKIHSIRKSFPGLLRMLPLLRWASITKTFLGGIIFFEGLVSGALSLSFKAS